MELVLRYIQQHTAATADAMVITAFWLQSSHSNSFRKYCMDPYSETDETLIKQYEFDTQTDYGK